MICFSFLVDIYFLTRKLVNDEKNKQFPRKNHGDYIDQQRGNRKNLVKGHFLVFVRSSAEWALTYIVMFS